MLSIAKIIGERKLVWSTGGMIMTQKIRSTGRKKIVLIQLFSSHIPHPRSKLVLRSESPANNHMNGGTAEMPIKQNHILIKKERQLEERKM
jgi:hypothetical protein